MLLRASALLAAAVALSCTSSRRAAPPASSQPTAASRAPATPQPKTADALAAAKAEPEKPKIVCEVERPTGSNLMKRVCYRVEDLEEMRREAQEFLQRASRQHGRPGD